MRYRQAVKDMQKYQDATEEELGRENTCIICREEMRPWDANDVTQVERSRPKRLPCGHILHLGCLKSWLERQQVCPTCRRSVVIDNAQPPRNRDAMVVRLGLNFPGGQNQAPPAGGGAAPGGQGAQNGAQQPPVGGNGVRMFNFGPIRLGFAQGGVNDIQEMAQRLGMPADVANGAAVPPPAPTQAQPAIVNDAQSAETIYAQLREVEQRIQRESVALRLAEQEARILRLLLTELQRIRQNQTQNATPLPRQDPTVTTGRGTNIPLTNLPTGGQPPETPQFQPQPQIPHLQPSYGPFVPRINSPSVMRLGADPNTSALPAGHPDLPDGVTIPPGWSLLPLQRLDGNGAVLAPSASGPHSHGVESQPMLQPLTQAQAAQSGPIVSPMASATMPGPTDASIRETQTNLSRRMVPDNQAPEIIQNTQQETHQNGDAHTEALGPHVAHDAAPIAQPTPVMPNWAGSSQLFGGGGVHFGERGPATGTSSSPFHEEGSTSHQQNAEATGQSGGPSSSSSSRSTEQNGSSDKGKAKAVTVEEAEDDDA